MRTCRWIAAITLSVASFFTLAQESGSTRALQLPVGPDTSILEAASGSLPEITAHAFGGLGYPTYAIRREVPLSYAAVLEVIPGAPQILADVYFGIIRPDGTHAQTWTVEAGEPVLKAGMSPLREGIDLRIVASYNTIQLFGEDIQHTIAGNEPSGMYLLFALLVAADSAPSNAMNWIAVDMRPLMVE